jgi:cation/acetate symporter
MVLSIWWKRLTVSGAIVGLISGFAMSAFAIMTGEIGSLLTPSPIAGILGLPVSLAVAVGISLMWPQANRHTLEVVRDIRVPGGEVIYDREMQRLQLRKHART